MVQGSLPPIDQRYSIINLIESKQIQSEVRLLLLVFFTGFSPYRPQQHHLQRGSDVLVEVF